MPFPFAALGLILSAISAYQQSKAQNTPKPPILDKTGAAAGGGVSPVRQVASDIAKSGAEGMAARAALPASPYVDKTGMTAAGSPIQKSSLGSLLDTVKGQQGMTSTPPTPQPASIAQGTQTAVDQNPALAPNADKTGKAGTSTADTLSKIQMGAALTGTAMDAMRSNIPPPPNPSLGGRGQVSSPTPVAPQFATPPTQQDPNAKLAALLALLRSSGR